MEFIEEMWPIARTIYSAADPELGAWLLYIVILVLSIIVYRLGFAKKLPLLKNVVVYIVLALGCTVLTLLGALLPIPEALAIVALILLIYKIRLRLSKKSEA
ncbi:YlaH-like family protein [Fredinandcohnia humi]